LAGYLCLRLGLHSGKTTENQTLFEAEKPLSIGETTQAF